MKFDYGMSNLRFWCQKVLPLVYDESLSYYELLCKVIDYLNKVVADVADLPEYIRELLSEENLKEILSELLDELREQIARANEGENKTASANRTKGDLIWLDGKLAKVTRNILAGDRYVEDTGEIGVTGNFIYTSVEDELQSVKTDVINFANTLVGDLEDLNTENKTDVVSAINEVLGDTVTNSSKIGTLSELDTSSKTNVVSAINELVETKLSTANIYNIVDYGAVGDGTTDCTDAIEEAIDDATTYGGVVYIPAGKYNITRTIDVAFDKPFSIMGVGDSSVLIHSTDNTIFNFTTRANLMTVKDLRITSTSVAKTSAVAFYFTLGCYRIIFENIRYDLDNEDALNMHYPYSFFSCPDNVNTDTVAFINCYMEHIDGPAYKLGTGSSIWVTGGRIVGTGFDLGRPNSIGVKCTGGMGGVYITSVDLIQLRVGIQISNAIDDENREFFIVNTTFDGDDLGMYITDADAGTYIEITGCWICTSNNIGIYSQAGAKPNVKISNTTISLMGLKATTPTDTVGLSINGGTWTVDSCRFWHNGGKALYINLSGSGDYGIFKNNVFHDNTKDADVLGYATISDNLLVDNPGITRYDNLSIVEHNQGQTAVVTPALPATTVGIVNDTGRHVLISLTGSDIYGLYLNNELQINKEGSIIASPKDGISIAYSGADLQWKWFDL